MDTLLTFSTISAIMIYLVFYALMLRLVWKIVKPMWRSIQEATNRISKN